MGQEQIAGFVVGADAQRELPNLTADERTELARVLSLISDGQDQPELIQSKNPRPWRISMAGDVMFVFRALDEISNGAAFLLRDVYRPSDPDHWRKWLL